MKVENYRPFILDMEILAVTLPSKIAGLLRYLSVSHPMVRKLITKVDQELQVLADETQTTLLEWQIQKWDSEPLPIVAKGIPPWSEVERRLSEVERDLERKTEKEGKLFSLNWNKKNIHPYLDFLENQKLEGSMMMVLLDKEQQYFLRHKRALPRYFDAWLRKECASVRYEMVSFLSNDMFYKKYRTWETKIVLGSIYEKIQEILDGADQKLQVLECLTEEEED